MFDQQIEQGVRNGFDLGHLDVGPDGKPKPESWPNLTDHDVGDR